MKFITKSNLEENLKSFLANIIKPYIDKELNSGTNSIKIFVWRSSEDMYQFGYTLTETPKVGDNFYYCARARDSEGYNEDGDFGFINAATFPRKIDAVENGVLAFDDDLDGTYTHYSRDAEHDITLTVN